MNTRFPYARRHCCSRNCFGVRGDLANKRSRNSSVAGGAYHGYWGRLSVHLV
jgi:hypothetical protein